MPIWATHPRIQEGELLSSWLIRIAAECGMTLSEFGKATLPLPNNKKLNLLNVDRNPSDDFLRAIFVGTGVPLERIKEATLLPEEGYLFSQSGEGASRWIAPTNTTQTAKHDRNAGLAYCPECFRSDKKPYYRKLWRYSFIAICPTHRIPLRNACPHCNTPYGNLIQSTYKNTDLYNPIAGCRSCGKNFCDISTPSLLNKDLIEQTLTIQDKIQSIVNCGCIELPNYGYVYSRAFLNGLYGTIQTLALSKYAKEKLSYLMNLSGIKLDTKTQANLSLDRAEFDRNSAEERAALICLAYWLMSDWPRRLEAYIEKFKISLFRSFLGRDQTYWLSSTMPIKIPLGKISDEEFANAKDILERRLNRPEQYYSVTTREVLAFIRDSMNEPSEAKPPTTSLSPWNVAFSKSWESDREIEKQRRLARIIELKRLKAIREKLEDQQKKLKNEN
jgi:hypothetical protein